MPNKKKKYNARFPPARIKKIMQTDEDVGKVAAAVPVIISRALELFIESLIMKASQTTQTRHAKTLTTAHIKQTIEAEKKFDFLRDLVVNITDHQTEEDPFEGNGSGSNSGETGNKKIGRIAGPRGPRKRKDSVASSDNNNIRRSKHKEHQEEEEEEEEEDNNNDEETDDADESEDDQEQQDLQDQNNQTEEDEEEEATTSSCLRGDEGQEEEAEESPLPSSNGFQPTSTAPPPGYHSLGQPSSQFKVPSALFSTTSLSRLFLPPGHTQGLQEEDDDYDT